MLSKIPLAAQRPLKLLFLAGLIFVAAVRLGSMTHDPAKTTAASASPSSKPVEPPVVVVPRVRPKAIVVDGRFEEADWSLRSARIAAFESTDSAEARPPSDARFLWDDEFLYIGTYAADADLRHDDSFEISMRGESAQLQFSLDPLGNFHPYPYEPRAVGPAPGLLAVKDVKGTVDDSKDGDKEWRFEIAVPKGACDFTCGRSEPSDCPPPLRRRRGRRGHAPL